MLRSAGSAVLTAFTPEPTGPAAIGAVDTTAAAIGVEDTPAVAATGALPSPQVLQRALLWARQQRRHGQLTSPPPLFMRLHQPYMSRRRSYTDREPITTD